MAVLQTELERITARVREVEQQRQASQEALQMFKRLAEDESTREQAEELIAYWFKQDRADYVERGWYNLIGEMDTDPNQLVGYFQIIANVFPDLAGPARELIDKLSADIEWWKEEGRYLHDQRMYELSEAQREAHADDERDYTSYEPTDDELREMHYAEIQERERGK